ncbi:MAG: hypothetical protein OSJ74_00005 [Clostridia bacterium]|nr:hypothetical protein [Clostridia bacterium]
MDRNTKEKYANLNWLKRKKTIKNMHKEIESLTKAIILWLMLQQSRRKK